MTETRGALARLMVFGSGIISLANSITIPFLAVFFRRDLGLSPAVVGFVVGSSVFFSITAGFLGGSLSDILGRKRVLVLSLLGVVVSFVGFYLSHHVAAVFACNAAMALCTSSFGPVGKALLSDMLPSDRRVTWFSYQYLAYNVGFAVGPVIGVWLGLSGGRLSFLFAALVYGIYCAAVTAVVLLATPDDVDKVVTDDKQLQTTGGVIKGLKDSVRAIGSDRSLLCFLAAAVLLEAVHSRVSVLLAQYLVSGFASGIQILAILMTTNAVTVVVCQLFVSRYVQMRNPVNSIVLGSLLLFTGMVGFAVAHEGSHFIVAMVVFTVGETFIIPAEFAIIDRIAPEERRGSYFGAQTFGQFGGFLGPFLGGLLLAQWGGTAMFLGVGALSLVSVVIYMTVGRRVPRLTGALVAAGNGGGDAVE